MKEAIVRVGTKVDIVDSPIPRPARDQVLIRIIVSGSNPKDWKRVESLGVAAESNQGDDMSGIIHEIGVNVSEFKPGDRVAAFHELFTPGGSFAEYGIAWKHTTFHLPPQVSFEEGAAIPLAALTAAMGLYERLRLPQPWTPASGEEEIPLLIYGGSSAVGSYAQQFARKSNIHPLIVVAGKSIQHVERFLDRSRGDAIVDYRSQDVVQDIKNALQGKKLMHVFDVTSIKTSFEQIAKVIDPHGTITTVLQETGAGGFGPSVRIDLTRVSEVHGPHKDLGHVYSRYISRGLDEGWFKAQPHEVIPGGLGGIEEGLTRLKEGRANAVKYVFRIADTAGLR